MVTSARKFNSWSLLNNSSLKPKWIEWKNKCIIYRLGVSPYREKLCPWSWKYWPWPVASVSTFKTSGTVFLYTELPASKWHIYVFKTNKVSTEKILHMVHKDFRCKIKCAQMPPSMACYIIPNQYCIVLSASLTEHTVHTV